MLLQCCIQTATCHSASAAVLASGSVSPGLSHAADLILHLHTGHTQLQIVPSPQGKPLTRVRRPVLRKRPQRVEQALRSWPSYLPG